MLCCLYESYRRRYHEYCGQSTSPVMPPPELILHRSSSPFFSPPDDIRQRPARVFIATGSGRSACALNPEKRAWIERSPAFELIVGFFRAVAHRLRATRKLAQCTLEGRPFCHSNKKGPPSPIALSEGTRRISAASAFSADPLKQLG